MEKSTRHIISHTEREKEKDVVQNICPLTDWPASEHWQSEWNREKGGWGDERGGKNRAKGKLKESFESENSDPGRESRKGLSPTLFFFPSSNVERERECITMKQSWKVKYTLLTFTTSCPWKSRTEAEKILPLNFNLLLDVDVPDVINLTFMRERNDERKWWRVRSLEGGKNENVFPINVLNEP